MAKAKSPQKPKRPADAVQRAIMIGKIATGEIADPRDKPLTNRNKSKKKKA